MDVIPSTTKLSKLFKLIPTALNGDFLLKYALDFIKEEYDYIFIDTHSGFDPFCHNALACADYVIIPAEANILGCEGLSEVVPVINSLKRRLNQRLEVAGILFTKFCGQTNNNKEFRDLVYRDFGDQIPIFEPVVGLRSAVSEAPNFGMSIHEYAPKSDAAAAYDAGRGATIAQKQSHSFR